MAIQDNNPLATQQANAQYFAANPMSFGGTQTVPTNQIPPTAAPTAPTLANGQQPGGLQMPTTPTTPPPTAPPPTNPPPTGLQMPTGAAANSVYDPISGRQVSPQEAAFNATKASGQPPPQDAGQVGTQVQDQIAKTTPPTPPPTPPNVAAFFQNNQTMAQQMKELTDLFSPPAQQQQIQDQITKLNTDQTTANALNVQAMNLEHLMSGQEDSVRQEIQASGGFATEQQIANLSTARNKSLLLQQQVLQQKISTAQQAIANDTSLLQNEKDAANQQFAQRTQIYQMIQQNQQNQLNAARDTIKTLMSTPGGLLAYANDSTQSAYADQIMGFAPGTIDQLAFQQQADIAYKKMQQQQEQLKFAQGQKQQQFENQLKLENLGLDKAKLGIEQGQLEISKGQLGVAQYNAQTSRMNASTDAAKASNSNFSEADLVAYAQQYAATGNVPTGIPKGTFGAISQVAGALPKAPGTIISSATGVVPPTSAFSNSQSDGLSATYNLITNVLPGLKDAFNKTTTNFGTGLFNALGMRTGNVTDYNSQRTQFLNALLLANSGKVVSETELKRYQSLIPSLSTLSKGNGNRQLDQLQTQLTDKLNSYLVNNQLNIVGYDPKNPTGLDIGSAAKFDQ